MLKKFLATVSVVGLVAGAANALEVTSTPQGFVADGTPGLPRVLAAELDYAGGAVVTTPGDAGLLAGEGNLRFGFSPTGAVAGARFPTGNVLLRVTVTGGNFDGSLTGAEVTTAGLGTSVISQGGANNGTDVTFLLSDVSQCVVATDCYVDLPLKLSGSNVSVSVGLETDAGAAIDNTSLQNLKAATLAVVAPAFTIEIDEDATATNATLASLFTELSDAVLGVADLGDFTVTATQVPFQVAAPPAPPTLVTVAKDLDGTLVTVADVASITASVEGDMAAFDDGDFTIGGVSATIDLDDNTAVRAAPLGAMFGAAQAVLVDPDGDTIIQRSNYDLTVTVAVPNGSVLQSGASATGSLNPIGREGTEVTFPWTQTGTQGSASGTSSVFRIGNLSTTATGAVYAEVKNASEAGFTSSGIVELAPSIAGSGEFVINSADLEAAVGNYGRGDVSFIIEAVDTSLTGRQFVVRNGNIQNVIGGTIAQDQ